MTTPWKKMKKGRVYKAVTANNWFLVVIICQIHLDILSFWELFHINILSRGDPQVSLLEVQAI